MNADKDFGPNAICTCGDTYARHGTSEDGGACTVYTREPRPGLNAHAFLRCQCDAFELAEDDA
jgi:hypothetical protein